MKKTISFITTLILILTLILNGQPLKQISVYADGGNDNPPISELSDESPIEINDATLEKALAKAAYVDEGCTITYKDMKKITYFGIPQGVKDYSALQYLTNIRLLSIYCTDANYNQIFKYVPLCMTELSFNNANAVDANLISKYTQLKTISFVNTDIKSVTSLSKLTNLEKIYICDSSLDSIKWTLNINKLNKIYISNCKINDKSSEKNTISKLKNKSIIVKYMKYKVQLPIKIAYSSPKNNAKISIIPSIITIVFTDKFNIGLPKIIHHNNIVTEGKCLELKLVDDKGKSYNIRPSFNNVDGNKLVIKINEKLLKGRRYTMIIPSKWIITTDCEKIANQKNIIYSFSIR